MDMLDYLLLAAVAAGILLAVRRLRRKGGCGCGGCTNSCSHCRKCADKIFSKKS